MKAEFFAQPNLLAGRQVVPEFFQEEVRPEVLGPALLAQLERPDRAELVATFTDIHHSPAPRRQRPRGRRHPGVARRNGPAAR